MSKQAMTPEKQLEYLLSFYDGFIQWKQQKQAEIEKIPANLRALVTAMGSNFRPFINHVVRSKIPPGADEREKYIARAKKTIEVGLNSFYMPAEFLEVDYLSDSGSSAMNTLQWAQLMQGDESYGSNEGWPIFNKQIADTFGQRYESVFLKDGPEKYRKNYNFIVNQGRGAENQLFPALAEMLVNRDFEKLGETVEYLILCSNNFFDTTSGHILNIKDRAIVAPNGKTINVTFKLVNHPNPKVKAGTYGANDRYLGDGDFDLLSSLVEKEHQRVGVVFTTITNNSGGSQPVSLDHIKKVSALCKKHNIMYIMDACRFAENAYMIKKLDNLKCSVQDVVYQIFEQVDGFTISLKKDGIANCGGAICFSPESKALKQFVDTKHGCLLQMIMDGIILAVGHFTYGSISGRDIKAICVGLQTVVQEAYLDGRVGQVHRFAKMLTDLGVPILTPCGTSAVYLDIDKFFARDRRGEYLGNSVVGLMLCAGIRGCELGVSAFYSPHGNAPYTSVAEVSGNFLRLAIPRQLYADEDLYASALYIAYLYENRDKILGVVDRPNIRCLSLHHFKMMFDFAK